MNNLLVFLLMNIKLGVNKFSLCWRMNSGIDCLGLSIEKECLNRYLQCLHCKVYIVTLEVIFFCLNTNEFSVNNFMIVGFLTIVWPKNEFLIFRNTAYILFGVVADVL